MEYKIERLGVAGTLACRFEHKGRRYSAQVDRIPRQAAEIPQ